MGICSSRKPEAVMVQHPIHVKKNQSILIDQELCDLSANDYRDEGNRAFKSGDYPRAIHAYTKAIELKPDDSIYYSNRALCYFRLQSYIETLSDCKKAISINPQSTRAFILSARSGLVLFFQSSEMPYLVEAEEDCELAISGYKLSKSRENENYCKKLRATIQAMKKIRSERMIQEETQEISDYYERVLEDSVFKELSELMTSKEEPSSNALVCCISFEFFKHPVATAEGFTYEKKNIELFLANSSTDPMSRRSLNNTVLYPNHVIRKLVKRLKIQQPWVYYEIQKGKYPRLHV